MIKDLAKNCILNHSNPNNTMAKKIYIQQQSEEIFYNEMIPNVLISFINEFMNVTDNSFTSEKALKKYVDENLIENVNFIICSEIWNDCLLIPHIMKEDPMICINNMFDLMIKDVVDECMKMKESEKN